MEKAGRTNAEVSYQGESQRVAASQDHPGGAEFARKPLTAILIGGDLCPFGPIAESFRDGDAGSIFHDLLPEFEAADYSLVNLECPLVARASPIPKAGPTYGADPGCVSGLKAAKIRAVNLANNHIMDHGAEGLRSTIDTCHLAGIACVGAGQDLGAANQLLIVRVGDERIAFHGMAEREFSIAGQAAWGANPLDLIDFCGRIRASRDQYDRLIVLVHGGAELFPYPSPRLQKTCRFLVEQGADAVICQHSHCAGTYEVFRGAPIVYGQGNLIHDIPNADELWYTGFLVRLITRKETVSLELEVVPYFQSRGRPGARRMASSEESDFRDRMDLRNEALCDPETLDALWTEFCKRQKPMYFSYLRAHGRLLRRLNGRLNFAERLCSSRSLLVFLDLLRCDTHREVVETLLEEATQSPHAHTTIGLVKVDPGRSIR